MIKINTAFAILLFSLLFTTASADKRKVLFVGNSYTYVNNLPKIITDIALSLGDSLTHDSSTPGGYTAQQHSTNATTMSKIAQGDWDYVSLQCQSQEPSFSPGQVATQTYPYIQFLDSVIQATNTCAETMMFMTWGRENGDANNCASYPPVCTYNGMQQRLRESYLLFANDFNTSVSPVGAAWKVMRDSFPTVPLYSSDGSHPSVNGTYLAACVFYCSMFKKSCVGSMYLPSGVGNSDALNMQSIASSLVLDSLENWQGDGGIPDASFVGGTWPGSGSATMFTNNSKRFVTSAWDFGDGSPIDNSTSPTHIFPSTIATYNVCLTVTSICGKKDSSCQSIYVDGTIGTNDIIETDKIKITQAPNTISINNELANCTLQIIDMNGRVNHAQALQTGLTNIKTHNFAKGIYIVQVRRKSQLLKLQKVFNY